MKNHKQKIHSRAWVERLFKKQSEQIDKALALRWPECKKKRDDLLARIEETKQGKNKDK